VAVGVQDAEWARQRDRAITVHAAELARREAAEAEQAGVLLRAFVESARDRGIPPADLRATSYDGRNRYRTGLRGWYLREDEGLAVDENGEFYILSVQGSLRARLTGVELRPARPRLVIGEGGRDGERITLGALLDRRLEA
jgi:hypothetical protein